MHNNPDTIREAMRIAQSDAGRQLLKMLQQSGGQELNQAVARAAAGDYSSATALLQQLVQDPRAKKLLEEMGGKYGPAGR